MKDHLIQVDSVNVDKNVKLTKQKNRYGISSGLGNEFPIIQEQQVKQSLSKTPMYCRVLVYNITSVDPYSQTATFRVRLHIVYEAKKTR